MELKHERLLMHALPFLVLIAIFAFNPRTSLESLNRLLALSSVVVVGITFLIGPLSRFSKRANRLKAYRKYLGLSSFVLMALHGSVSFYLFYGLDAGILLDLDSPMTLQAYSAVVALLIFLLMSVTSSVRAIRLMGPRRWKMLQNTGYLAMALVMLHFMLANSSSAGFQITRIYALAAFVFGILVILARLFVLGLVHLEASKRG